MASQTQRSQIQQPNSKKLEQWRLDQVKVGRQTCFSICNTLLCMQCAYLFLRCKFEPSHHQMQGQPTDQWETHFGNMMQAVIGRVLGQASLLTAHHTHFSKTLFRLFQRSFQLAPFPGRHSAIGPTKFTFWPTCSLQGTTWLPQNLKSSLFGRGHCVAAT